MVETYVEKRKRGIFGWLFLIVFWLWHPMMIWWLVEYGRWANDKIGTYGRATPGRIGAEAGATMAVGFIIFVWVAGSVILGLMVFFTRGQKRLIRVDEPKA